MRYLIANPCMDHVHTLFYTSMMGLQRPEGTEIAVTSSSLVYDARNQLARRAVENGFDRVLWLDSDMTFEPDLLNRLAADMDAGAEMVIVLYFTRKIPVEPCAYARIWERPLPDGSKVPTVDPITEWPENDLMEIAGCGFGGVMMSTDLIRRVAERHRLPFSPAIGYGEDISFCLRVRDLGATIYLDPRIKVGHAGISIVNESTWLSGKQEA